MRSSRKSLALGAIAGLAAHACACTLSNALVSSGPSPRVEECAPIQQATPTRYICGGKQYTSVQLMDIRLGKPATSVK